MSNNPSNRSNATLIICEVIAAIAVIFGGAYWQFKAAPATEHTQFIGRVVDANNALPVADADVSLERTGALPKSTQTDSDGSFIFKLSDTDGLARVRVEASGYDNRNKLISLADTTANERIELQPSAPSIPAVDTQKGRAESAPVIRDCSRLKPGTLRQQLCLERLEM